MNIDLSVFFLKVTGGVTFLSKVTGGVTSALLLSHFLALPTIIWGVTFLSKVTGGVTSALLLSHFLALPTIIFRFSVYFFYRYVFCPNATSRID
jgi:hypothetical protein